MPAIRRSKSAGTEFGNKNIASAGVINRFDDSRDLALGRNDGKNNVSVAIPSTVFPSLASGR